MLIKYSNIFYEAAGSKGKVEEISIDLEGKAEKWLTLIYNNFSKNFAAEVNKIIKYRNYRWDLLEENEHSWRSYMMMKDAMTNPWRGSITI